MEWVETRRNFKMKERKVECVTRGFVFPPNGRIIGVEVGWGTSREQK